MPDSMPPSNPATTLSAQLAAELKPERLISGLAAGLVASVINVIVGISLAALIFAGELSGFVSQAIGLILLGGIVAVIVTGLLSSHSGTICATQDAPAAILAVLAGAILRALPAATPAEEKFMTVAAAVAAASLITGLGFVLLGQFKLGALVRFLPYPVVGGFLAGTGWLLVTGGVGVMADVSFNLAQPGALFQPGVLIRWAPGVVLAVGMLALLNRYDYFWLLPGMLLAIAALFAGAVWLSGLTFSQVGAQGWLLGPFQSGSLWHVWQPSDLSLVHWTAIGSQAGNLASIVLVSVVALLLNASGIELVIRQDLDLNQELRAVGVSNLLGALVGGTVSYHALADTVLNYRASRGSRVAVFATAAFVALALLFGAAVLSYIPKLVLGALLVLLGLSFLYEWVYQAWSKFPKVDYLVIWLILIVIATVGYLQGVGVGLLAAIGLFVVNYSRVDVVKRALSGAEFQSRVTRSASQRRTLLEHGDELYILQLQGFVFFGTANKLLEHVRQRLSRPGAVPLGFVVLDFAQVTGLDSTALLRFAKIRQVAHTAGVILLVTGASAQVRRQLERGDFISKAEGGAFVFQDLDHGVEWCEERILSKAGMLSGKCGPTLQAQFQALLPEAGELANLFQYLERHEVEAGACLMHQGKAPDYLYFVESGQVTARLEENAQAPVRLETMRGGHVLGEIGFYLGEERTATVVADEPSIVYSLSSTELENMEQHDPEAASTFHKLIVHLLAERAVHLIRVVNALQR